MSLCLLGIVLFKTKWHFVESRMGGIRKSLLVHLCSMSAIIEGTILSPLLELGGQTEATRDRNGRKSLPELLRGMVREKSLPSSPALTGISPQQHPPPSSSLSDWAGSQGPICTTHARTQKGRNSATDRDGDR